MACDNCTSTFTTDCTCSECTGCPVLLDTSCVIYHKDNNEVTALTSLDLTNGATLELILETIDSNLSLLNVPSYSLTYLRSLYTVNTFQQFAQSVDTQLSQLNTAIVDAGGVTATELSVTDSTTIDFSVSGTLNHTLAGNVKVSTVANNRLSVLSDGLFATAQNLSVNNTTKELSISGGNTVSLAALASGVGGWLGNLAADPTAIDGQYWFNTTSNVLKIKANGTVKSITTT